VDRPCLLKRSVILVKAWSYYEARILGAHHSLMSSYALEVMVLYILLHYHEQAQTPLTLLQTFLDVLSQFDWSRYALSLQGPVTLGSLFEGPVAAQTGENHTSAHLQACNLLQHALSVSNACSPLHLPLCHPPLVASRTSRMGASSPACACSVSDPTT
jgi:hypothetical protein